MCMCARPLVQELEQTYARLMGAGDAALGIEDCEGPVAARSSMAALLDYLKHQMAEVRVPTPARSSARPRSHPATQPINHLPASLRTLHVPSGYVCRRGRERGGATLQISSRCMWALGSQRGVCGARRSRAGGASSSSWGETSTAAEA